jgi:hypothetical protein
MLDMMGHVSAAMLRCYSYLLEKASGEAMTGLEKPRLMGVPAESPTIGDSKDNPKRRCFGLISLGR